MKIAILDPAAGISGDMLLGALLDAGLDPRWLTDLPLRLGFDGVAVEITRVVRCSLAATKVDFRIGGVVDGLGAAGGHGHGRHIGELLDLVRAAEIPESSKKRACAAFQLIGEAEGAVHGVTPERVHLHEVGAIDAVLDIVGAITGIEQLGVERVYNTPVALGDGWVEAAHGRLPVPAPATAILLSGVDVLSGAPVSGEATTPTGAALIRVLSEGPPPPGWRMVTSGWGAGSRDPQGYPNALRLFVGETGPEAGTVEVLSTDIDDLQPEYIEPLRQALFAAGALECLVWPTQGKKGRVSLRIEVHARPGEATLVREQLFRHSTTAGVRSVTMSRVTLARSVVTVEIAPGIAVRVKVLEGPRRSWKAEYDDVVVAAEAMQLPAVDVARLAENLAVNNSN